MYVRATAGSRIIRMDIDHDTYKRLKQLLLGLPVWTTREKREELVKDALF